MRTAAVFFLIAELAAAPAPAIPAPSGKYTVSGTEICQIVTSGTAYIDKGEAIRQLGTITLTSTTAGATGTHAQYGIEGSLADQSTVMTAESQSLAIVITLSGTTDPYGFPMKATVGGKSITSTGKIQLDDVVSNIARRATIVAMEKSGDVSNHDCGFPMILGHR